MFEYITYDQQLYLASSTEFSVVLSADPVLDELDAQRIDYEAEQNAVFELIGANYIVLGIPVRPITPAVWSILWSIRSPFTSDAASVTVEDASVLLYLLRHSLLDVTPYTLMHDARAYWIPAGLKGKESDLITEMVKMVKLAFRPLEMLPSVSGRAQDPVFDADWLLTVCTAAAQETNTTLKVVMTSMPLSTVMGCTVIRMRRADPSSAIYRHTDETIAQAVLKRTEVLADAFLAEHYKKDVSCPQSEK